MSLAETRGRYRVLERIAAGGMGEVYRARVSTVDGVARDVALKVVRAELARDPEFAQLFVEEAKVAMSLVHANIVHAYDVGRIDERWFLAMEYVDGIDLSLLIHACQTRLGQPLPHRHVLFIAVEALKGLDYAHRRKTPEGLPLAIVHRDISPGNLLISFEGEVKVADFGIAKSTMRSTGSQRGTVKGKLPYMAPEQLRGAVVDRRADLYSMGAVLYEMLTGRNPLGGGTFEVGKAIETVLAGTFPRPRQIEPSVSEELERIAMRAMSLDPEDRYLNAAAMRQELEAHAQARGFMLSSPDLADFVREVIATPVPGSRTDALTTPDAARLGQARTLLGIGFSATAAPPVDAADAADPFDSILGQELQKLETSDPFSVFTASEAPAVDRRTQRASFAAARAAAIAGAATTAGGGGAEAPIATGATDVPTRRVPWIATVAIALLVAGGAVALAMVQESGDDVAATGDATVSRPPSAGPQPPAFGIEPSDSRSALERAPDTQPPAGVDPPAAIEPPETAPARVESERSSKRRGRVARAHDRATATSPAPATTQASEPAATSRPTLLSANTDPWAEVFVDGARAGTTPLLRHAIAPGRHQITFRNPSEGLERSVTVEIAEGDHRRVSLDLR